MGSPLAMFFLSFCLLCYVLCLACFLFARVFLFVLLFFEEPAGSVRVFFDSFTLDLLQKTSILYLDLLQELPNFTLDLLQKTAILSLDLLQLCLVCLCISLKSSIFAAIFE